MGSVFISPCPPESYYEAKRKLSLISGYFRFALPAGMLLQSKTKIEPDLRLNKTLHIMQAMLTINYVLQHGPSCQKRAQTVIILFFFFQANEAFKFVMQRKSTGKVVINTR